MDVRSPEKNYKKVRILDGLGRVTIPADIRRKLKLRDGITTVIVELQDDKIVVIPYEL